MDRRTMRSFSAIKNVMERCVINLVLSRESLDEGYDEELGEFISVDDSNFWFAASRFKMFEDDFEGNV